ncbi:MAG: tRNA (adenosine(37)-N6)-dimethylallyltransferase MiaA [Bacteroidia bacterium]|nr:tRNA (adenosine(37)-N6)-dimethylallyltransferase MiaA [Bacteroidia bacterium]
MSGTSKYLVVIAGPTAVGKTKMAIELARYYNTEILSADSRQFYRELNIGTAKPSATELAAAPHHFINSKSIGELYGAGHFEKDALAKLDNLFETHSLVILVGGSGLYINALLHGVDEYEEVPAPLREKINAEFELRGLEWLQNELKIKDPDYFKEVDIQNPQRMIRALEVCVHTGKPFSSFRKNEKKERPFTPIGIFLNTRREALYEKINLRVDEMMDNGLLEETRKCLPHRQFNALKTVGYKELFDYLDGKYTLKEAVEKIKQHTRNYAKRQITWFKNSLELEEFEPDATEKIKAYIDIILTHG